MSKRNGPLRYAAYLRCSTDDQAHGDFTTIDTQREINAEHIRIQGGVMVKEYADEGKSGTNLKRPGWQSLLSDAEAGRFDAVCVTYMSRLARGEAYHIAEWLLKERKVCVEFAKEKFTPDLAGHVAKSMTVFMDGMYPKMVSQWTRAKMEQMVAHGYFCGGKAPYGYRTEFIEGAEVNSRNDKEPPKRLIIHEPEAEVVRAAYSLLVKQRSLAAVRDYLNRTTVRRWTSTTTKYLLTSSTYIGIQTVGEWRNDNAHAPLVDRDLWESAQDVFRGRALRRIPEARPDFTYYLQGVVKCPHCGCSYTPASAKSGAVRYYSCVNGMNRTCPCPVGRVNADALHEAVLDAIQRAAKHHTVMHRVIAESGGWSNAQDDLHRRRGELGKRKQFVDVQIGNLTRAIEEGSRNFRSILATLATREDERDKIVQEIARAEREIKAATVLRPTAKQVQEAWSELVDLWPTLTEAERVKVLTGIIRNVEVKEKNRVSLDCLPISGNHGSKFATRTIWEPVGIELANYPTLRIEATIKPRPRGRAAQAKAA